MDGAPGAEILFISLLTHSHENVTRWLYLWAVMESWLMAVDRAGRHAGSWSYIQGSTCNHEDEGKTNNLRWMLYSVYAVLSVFLYLVYAVLCVNSWSRHREIERNDLTLCSALIRELWTRKREMEEEDENHVEDTSGYEESGVQRAWLGWEDRLSVSIQAGWGLVPAVSGMVNWLPHEILLSPSSSSWFPPSPLISLFLVLNSTIT